MKVLLLGSSSFAAQGLAELLERQGHEVWTFNRGASETRAGSSCSGDYARLADVLEPARDFDALINFAIVKFGSIEDNRILQTQIVEAAEKIGVGRFIHISSISVLPSDRAVVDESSPATMSRWKGSYSRIKVDTEEFLAKHWASSPLFFTRPGFILADEVIDSIVGIGKRLPTGHVLGLGNARTIIPLVSRQAVHAALLKLIDLPISGSRNFMLVSPDAPTRREYLDFHCFELGRGSRTVHLPPWVWKWGLAFVSPLLSILKRQPFRLAKLFEHNLVVRNYRCDITAESLGLDLHFDWRAQLRRIYRTESTGAESTHAEVGPPIPKAEQVIYFGFGRIVRQKHLGALKRMGFKGQVFVRDPALRELPPLAQPYSVAAAPQRLDGITHAVIASPWTSRGEVLGILPPSVRYVLLEKPFATSRQHLREMGSLTGDRQAYVLHNYRLKQNVREFRRFLGERRSGRLRHVTVRFETPSPAIESSAWVRKERAHRILLTDYAMHFLDLAWMFFSGSMNIQHLRVAHNARGETESVHALLSFADAECMLIIRQGGHRREAHIHYAFQNYDAHLRFFPDVFAATFGGHSALDDIRLAGASVAPTAAKIADKLGLLTADLSHDGILAAFLGLQSDVPIGEFSVSSLLPFYSWLTDLADAVYDPALPASDG